MHHKCILPEKYIKLSKENKRNLSKTWNRLTFLRYVTKNTTNRREMGKLHFIVKIETIFALWKEDTGKRMK